MQTLLPPKHIEMHPIKVIDQLKESCEPKQPEVRNQPEQQKGVEAKHKEEELKSHKPEQLEDHKPRHQEGHKPEQQKGVEV